MWENLDMYMDTQKNMKKNAEEYLQKREELAEQLKTTKLALLRGSLVERYKRCGKPNCKCTKGKGHGPYYYLSISVYGKSPIMTYVPIELKKLVEESLNNYKETQAAIEKICDINREFLKEKIPF
jgi:hypothetical protein